MRLGRRAVEPPNPIPDIVAGMAQRAMVKNYSAGFAAGAQVTLEMLLNLPGIEGVAPYTGPLDPQARAWAEQALERVKGLGL